MCVGGEAGVKSRCKNVGVIPGMLHTIWNSVHTLGKRHTLQLCLCPVTEPYI